MKLDDIEKLCNEATPPNKPMSYSGIALDVSDADARFIDASRTLMPKLLEVARAAQMLTELDELEPWGFAAQSTFELLEAALAKLEAST